MMARLHGVVSKALVLVVFADLFAAAVVEIRLFVCPHSSNADCPTDRTYCPPI